MSDEVDLAVLIGILLSYFLMNIIRQFFYRLFGRRVIDVDGAIAINSKMIFYFDHGTCGAFHSMQENDEFPFYNLFSEVCTSANIGDQNETD
jgi:hypothetical protein